MRYSIESLLHATATFALGMAAFTWITGSSNIHLPELLPASAGLIPIGIFIAPLGFAICTTCCVASGLNRNCVLDTAIVYGVVALAGQLFGQVNMANLERYVATLFALIAVSTFETTLRRVWKEHFATVAAMAIASCCMYLFWFVVKPSGSV